MDLGYLLDNTTPRELHVEGAKLNHPMYQKVHDYMYASDLIVDYREEDGEVTSEFLHKPGCPLRTVLGMLNKPPGYAYERTFLSMLNMERGIAMEDRVLKLYEDYFKTFPEYVTDKQWLKRVVMGFQKKTTYSMVRQQYMDSFEIVPGLRVVGKTDALILKDGKPLLGFELKSPNDGRIDATTRILTSSGQMKGGWWAYSKGYPQTSWVTQSGAYLTSGIPKFWIYAISGGTNLYYPYELTIIDRDGKPFIRVNMIYQEAVLQTFWMPWRSVVRGAETVLEIKEQVNQQAPIPELVDRMVEQFGCSKTDYPCAWQFDKKTDPDKKCPGETCKYFSFCHHGEDLYSKTWDDYHHELQEVKDNMIEQKILNYLGPEEVL